ncbi:hypothetical protein A0H81_04463 [Grifola frondosa]|uniref:Uncharacterized protein n=1 Tax=Grifola frondosa TaxID=5627 RepID=A0A1C7MFY8_GRIFR|nr:hypothetical protein A0H81_04463 [Grifola frondosa]
MQPADKANLIRAEAELVLEEARKQKAERTKDLGWPIQIPGAALDIKIRGNIAWIAENTTVIRKLDLEVSVFSNIRHQPDVDCVQTGKTLQLFRGHTAPVTRLTFYDKIQGSGAGDILITGSWDKTIKLWDTETKALISSTPAHADFVKSLLVIPSLQLLVSGSSDKIVRFWQVMLDLSSLQDGKPLTSAGSISDHTRPVESLDARPLSDTSAVLYTADTMGIIKVWKITKEAGAPPRWRSILQEELKHHRTRINEMVYGNGQLWTGIPFHESSAARLTGFSYVTQPLRMTPYKSGHNQPHPRRLHVSRQASAAHNASYRRDVIRVYDVSAPEEPELLSEVDAHWHDVTALRLWMRRSATEDVGPRWRLSELLQPPPPKRLKQSRWLLPAVREVVRTVPDVGRRRAGMAELMDSD